jgi:hypothetical protein
MVTKPRFNWKMFLILWLASILGVIAVIPYTLTLQGAQARNLPMPLEVLIPIQVAENAIIFGVAAALGLFFAYRCGLGVPLLDAWTRGEPVRVDWRMWVVPALLIGVAGTLLVIALDLFVFMPALRSELGDLARGMESPAARPPAWQGFFASFYGGIDEEILLRLFVLSLLAFLGKVVSHTPEGRPTPVVLWTANVLAAILFGLGHLPATALLVPITPLVVLRAVVLNGIVGVGTGYLYFTRGLEDAMLAHFSADLVLHVLIAL